MTPPVLSGRYELLEQIGSGGMGEVWRANDTQLGRDVAVKLLRADLAHRAEMADRIRREAIAAARLTHPSAVVVFDAGEWDGGPFIVMELLPGRTFDDELRDGPVAAERACTVGVDVLRALGAAHEIGIVHRDVKPGNLLLTSEGRVKVGDFGIARSAESLSLTLTGQLLGTPVYMAPEQLRDGSATASSDVYAVGVVLYEALSGVRPFDGDTPLAVAVAATTTSAVPLAERCPTLDPALAGAVDRAMAPEPDDRYGSADEMADELAALRLGVSTTERGRDEATDLSPPTRVMTPVTMAQDPTRTGAPTEVGPPTDTRAPSPLHVAASEGTARQRAARRLAPMLTGVAVALVLLVGVWLATRDGDAPAVVDESPATPETTVDIPAPLEESLRRLEELATR